jgi:hypothetical protein
MSQQQQHMKVELVLLSRPSTGTTARYVPSFTHNSQHCLIYSKMGSHFFMLLFSSCRASSVLQRNSKLYGPKHALDCENASTCWNSDGSTPGTTLQPVSFIVDFGRSVHPTDLKLQIQAGFCAEQLTVFVQQPHANNNNSTNREEWTKLVELQVDDDHELQSFSLPTAPTSCTSAGTPSAYCNALKLIFDDFTDFYGRTTIYQLQVWGYEEIGR